MFHKPSSTCTNLSVGESSQVCAPTTQIMATPQEICEHVLGDGAPKGTGQTTPTYAAPPRLQTLFKVPTLESQMTPSMRIEVRTIKTASPSKPPLHYNRLVKLELNKDNTPKS